MFSASAPGYLLARIAILFESKPNAIGMTSMVALNVISVVYMIAVFCVAILWERDKIRKTSIQ
jgi:hypothetical protein